MKNPFVVPIHPSENIHLFTKRVARPSRWALLAVRLALSAAGTIWWTKAQGLGSTQPAPTSLEELQTIELNDPARFAALMEQTKTPEDYQRQYFNSLGLTNLPAYLALFPKSAADLDREAAAAYAITHPPTIEQAMRTLPAAQQRDFQKSLDAILNPDPAQGH